MLQAYLRPGDEIVIPLDVYGGTYRILNSVFQPIGVTIKQFDISDRSALEAAITERTKLVWIESPTNPRLLVYDIVEICKLAHAKCALVVVDNTFATPYFQQPFELGADIVVHSVTKYLGGHSDTIQGAALAKDPAIFEPIKFLQNATGAVPSPFDCWLTLRGLKTLELRMQRHEENAIAIADALKGIRWFSAFISPGLRASGPRHRPQPDERIWRNGFVRTRRNHRRSGGVLLLTALFHARREFGRGESAALPSRDDDARFDPRRGPRGTRPFDTLLRLSPGCENAEDLVEDLLEGLTLLDHQRKTQKVVAAGAH